MIVRWPLDMPIYPRTYSTLTAPELRLHARGSARTLDCCALPAVTCECRPAEQQLTPHPPVGRKFLPKSSCPQGRSALPARELGSIQTLLASGPLPQPKSFLSIHKPSETQSKTFLSSHEPRRTPSYSTILLLKPSSNSLYSRSLHFPNIHLCEK